MEPFIYDGLWSRLGREDPSGHPTWLRIDAGRMRAITFIPRQIRSATDEKNPIPATFPFPLLPADPVRLHRWCYVWISAWYRQEEGGMFLSRRRDPEQFSEWLPHFYRFDGDTFVLLRNGVEYPYTSVPFENAPDWMEKYVERIYTKMDQQEKELGASPLEN